MAVGGPGERQTLRRLRLAGGGHDLGLQFLDHLFGLEIPDLDPRPEGRAEPVTVGAEAQRRDDVVVIEGVEVFAVVQVPQHRLAVLAIENNM